jgi:hypothetical protein
LYQLISYIPPFLPNPQEFKGITKWILPSEEEAEEVAPIMEGIIKVKLGIDDQGEEDEEDEEEDEEEEEE